MSIQIACVGEGIMYCSALAARRRILGLKAIFLCRKVVVWLCLGAFCSTFEYVTLNDLRGGVKAIPELPNDCRAF